MAEWREIRAGATESAVRAKVELAIWGKCSTRGLGSGAGGTLLSMLAARASNTHFLNVDLDIDSKHDLKPLIACFGRNVSVLFVGREKGKFSAHLEIAKRTTTADATIRGFCQLITALPERGRRIWDAATVRSFSIGVRAEIGSPVRDFQIRPATVTAVSKVGAEIVLTVYAPEREIPRR